MPNCGDVIEHILAIYIVYLPNSQVLKQLMSMNLIIGLNAAGVRTSMLQLLKTSL